MKSVLISIQPKWCELIASGEKIVEVRKTKPKIETPFKVYIYATKGEALWKIRKRPILIVPTYDNRQYVAENEYYSVDEVQGKVIGEFVCDQIDEIGYSPEMHGKYISDIDDIHYVSCLDFEQMYDYLADGYGYAWHISDLVIYDKPKELGEFYPYCDGECTGCKYLEWVEQYQSDTCTKTRLTRPPQSWCYVERLKGEIE